MTKKKIIHIITSLKQGGAESLLVYFLRYADKTHFEHVVIYFYDGPCAQKIRALGVTLYHVAKPKYGYSPTFFLNVYRTVRQLQPDCIHTWLWMANMLGRFLWIFLRIPVINSFHNNVDQDGFIRSSLDQITYKAANVLVAVSHGVAASLRARQKDIATNTSLTIITNGIAADEILQQAQSVGLHRKDIGLGPEHFIIGSVGRFVHLKNYPLLLEAFAQVFAHIPQARLLLIGSGPQEQELQRKAQQLGIEAVVQFLGEQVAVGYYSLFDCFALSSFKEGISIALLEAMSCGLPCVVTNYALTHDVIIHGHNGLLVHPMTAEAMARSFEALCTDKAHRMFLGKNAFETVRNEFCITTMIHAYYDLYEKCIEKSPQRLL